MAISFKGAHFPQDIILMGVRWYVAYPLPGSNGEIFGAKGLLVRADGAAVIPGVSIPPPRSSDISHTH